MRYLRPSIFCVVLSMFSSQAMCQAPFIRGDVDTTSGLNITDAVRLLNFLFTEGVPPVCEDSADANDDGSVDISDAISILGFLFLGGEALPPPFLSCGIDPTADDLSCDIFPPCSDCEDCPPPGRCVPTPGDALVCTTELNTCEEVRDLYDFLVWELGQGCAEGESCQLLLGHCGIGIGGCYHAVNDRIRQEDLDALAARFQDLRCTGPVCDCAPPPDETHCDGERCQPGREEP